MTVEVIFSISAKHQSLPDCPNIKLSLEEKNVARMDSFTRYHMLLEGSILLIWKKIINKIPGVNQSPVLSLRKGSLI
jgi:hypothetical protein